MKENRLIIGIVVLLSVLILLIGIGFSLNNQDSRITLRKTFQKVGNLSKQKFIITRKRGRL
jgi:hypothetical protein